MHVVPCVFRAFTYFTYVCFLTCSLDIDPISSLNPALCHGDNFFPGVSHLLHFTLQVTAPGVY